MDQCTRCETQLPDSNICMGCGFNNNKEKWSYKKYITPFFVTLLIAVSHYNIFILYNQNKSLNKIIDNKNISISLLYDANRKTMETIKEIYSDLTQTVSLTAYHPKSGGINSDSNPNKTATMRKPIVGRTLAISTELFELGWLDKKIYIDGWGVGHATDRMDTKVKGKKIDICVGTLKDAKKFGIKRSVLATVLIGEK